LQSIQAQHILSTNQKNKTINFGLPLVDLIPILSPHLEAPYHLAPYAVEIDKAIDRAKNHEGTFTGLSFAAPPQHGKTCTTEHGLVKALVALQGYSHAYATYSQAVTLRVESETRRICESIGLEIKGTRIDWWVPLTKSRVRWTSAGGPLTSDPVSGLLIIDDAFKDYKSARSIIDREDRWDWLVQVALRRLHPGASVLNMGTRWVPDDLTGRLIDRLKWSYLNIQAICEDPANDLLHRELGAALWPSKRPLDFLMLQKSADPFSFRAQYQGEPQELGAQLFEEPDRFTDIPNGNHSTAYGCDLAYSKKTIADWSCILRGRKVGDTLYVIHSVRKQVDATKFLDDMKAEVKFMPGPIRFYHGAGGELGVCSFISRELDGFNYIQATSDKVTRSTKARQAWNLKKILVPSPDSPYYGSWVEPFVNEVIQFTGQGDRNDDQIDELAALYDQLFSGVIDWDGIDDLQSQFGGSWRM
jgi:hypothetical protein